MFHFFLLKDHVKVLYKKGLYVGRKFRFLLKNNNQAKFPVITEK